MQLRHPQAKKKATVANSLGEYNRVRIGDAASSNNWAKSGPIAKVRNSLSSCCPTPLVIAQLFLTSNAWHTAGGNTIRDNATNLLTSSRCIDNYGKHTGIHTLRPKNCRTVSTTYRACSIERCSPIGKLKSIESV